MFVTSRSRTDVPGVSENSRKTLYNKVRTSSVCPVIMTMRVSRSEFADERAEKYNNNWRPDENRPSVGPAASGLT